MEELLKPILFEDEDDEFDYGSDDEDDDSDFEDEGDYDDTE